MASKAVFLDRDGTINIEKNYLYKPEDFEFIDLVIDAIKLFHNLGYKVIVISNQAGVAKGYYTEEDVKKLHHFISSELIKHETSIDAFYYCPHHIDANLDEYRIVCECRKPKSGMILNAKKDFDIDLVSSILVGDNETDIQSGITVGLEACYLVRSGHKIDETNSKANVIFDSLIDVANYLLNKA